jgi:hypothetical protein
MSDDCPLAGDGDVGDVMEDAGNPFGRPCRAAEGASMTRPRGIEATEGTPEGRRRGRSKGFVAAASATTTSTAIPREKDSRQWARWSINRRMNATPRSNWSTVMNSLGWWAWSMLPGPHMATDRPAAWNWPASAP